MKCCIQLDVAQERCPIVFQGHPSNFKVTWLKKMSIFTQIGRFRTVTPVLTHQWLRNDAQSLGGISRGHPPLLNSVGSGVVWVTGLFSLCIHQISMSHELKNWRFESNLRKITRPVARGGGVLTIFWVTGRLGPFDPPFSTYVEFWPPLLGSDVEYWPPFFKHCRILTPIFQHVEFWPPFSDL